VALTHPPMPVPSKNPAFFELARREAVADQHWATIQREDEQNEELHRVSREILKLTKRAYVAEPAVPGAASIAVDPAREGKA
jgi:hypothetical protein